jgi:rsbT antagonist protein RsbS
MSSSDVPRVPLQLSRGVVVASIQLDLSPAIIDHFRQDLLAFAQRSGAAGVLIDVSGVDLMDFDDFEGLRRTIEMVKLIGLRTVVSGLQAGAASALVELGVAAQSFVTALNLDEGFKLLVPQT